MPDIVINGPAGRIEGRYHQAAEVGAPLAVVLHNYPKMKGTMHHPVVQQIYSALVARGFTVLRFNFRGVGRSEGNHENGHGELADAAAALDWLQTLHPESAKCWVTGYSFGAWVGMQLLMRRPEVDGFISVSPPANFFDFSFLSPCPTSGLIVSGGKDIVVPPTHITKMIKQLKTQQNTEITHLSVEDANHFYSKCETQLHDLIEGYLRSKIDPLPTQIEDKSDKIDEIDEAINAENSNLNVIEA